MNLHFDKDAFITVIQNVHKRTGLREDVLEKDYYVVLILRELSQKQNGSDQLPAYFKGGTALYKALKTTNRFSEDIDISVDTRDCSRTQNEKRLRKATKEYTSLDRDLSESKNKTKQHEVITAYTYEPFTSYDENDSLQRFGTVKIEATSFTISEPVEDLEIAPLIYDLGTSEQKAVLKDMYGVEPFYIKTMTLERIFIDKLFAAEAYFRKSNQDPKYPFETAKHIYDLSVLEKHPKIVALLSDEHKLKSLLDIRMQEEVNRLDGIPGVHPCEFTFFNAVLSCSAVRSAYGKMQDQYVLSDNYRIAFEDVAESLARTQEKLWQNTVWKSYHLPKIATIDEEIEV